MKILAVESSAGPASCAIVEDGRVLACSSMHVGLTHSQTLLPMIDAMMKNAGMTLNEMDMLAVAVGPGSFTGIRIGVSAVKGLAFAQNKPCIGVSTLAAMARRVEGLPYNGVVCAAMDARCQQVYAALFECRNGCLTRLTTDAAVSLEALKNSEEISENSVLFIGDGAQLCYNVLNMVCPSAVLAPPALRYQDAVGVALEAAASADQTMSPDALQPVYLRLPQAERELRAKHH